jgi:hypothetical protein
MLARSLRQQLDPIAKAAFVRLGGRLDPLAEVPHVNLARDLGQLLDSFAEAPYVWLGREIRRLLDASDVPDWPFITSGLMCPLRAHERPPIRYIGIRYRITI